MAIKTTSIELVAVAPTGASFLLSATAKGDVHSSSPAGRGGDREEGADSAVLGFEFFAASGVETEQEEEEMTKLVLLLPLLASSLFPGWNQQLPKVLIVC
jgi:hypothetical protein